jgi:hypothetical protein
MRRKNILIVINVFLFNLILLLILALASCTTGNNIPTSETYWRYNSSGDIETNDIKRLQEIVPFNIVLPKYLPKDLAEYHPDLRYSGDENAPQEISLIISYWTIYTPNSIHFEEITSPYMVDFLTPVPGLSYNFLNFKDTEVLERALIETTIGQQTVFIYRWVIDEVYFQATTTGYDQDEARKVIESMIK